MSGNLHCFSRTFLLVNRSGISAQSKITAAQDVHVSTWICSAIYLIYCNIPEFILQQIIDDLIVGKLDLSQIIKTKQVFIVCDWKEDTSVEEEERKVIATRFIISYL